MRHTAPSEPNSAVHPGSVMLSTGTTYFIPIYYALENGGRRLVRQSINSVLKQVERVVATSNLFQLPKYSKIAKRRFSVVFFRGALANDVLTLWVLHIENIPVFRIREFQQDVRNALTRVHALLEGHDSYSYVRLLGERLHLSQLPSHDIASPYHSADDGFIHDEVEFGGGVAYD